MSFKRLFVCLAVLGFAAVAITAAPARAQEVSASHMAAALDAVTSARASRSFDNVLPLLSERTQNQLIRLRPDLHKEISEAVDAVALSLVARRAELDNDIARIWAKTFSEDELNGIAAFYKSPAGIKFLELAPTAITESLQVVDQWSKRVGEEMSEESRAELKKQGIEF